MNLSDKDFQDARQLVKDLCGIWLGQDKKYLIQSRLEPLLHRHKISTYADLVNRCTLPLGLRLQDEVVEAITTKETSFNRDGHPFEELRKTILPTLIQNRVERQRSLGLPFGKLRVWSAASSTGQEVYSTAIAIFEWINSQSKDEAGRRLLGTDNFQILGTDISNEAIRVAKEGVYAKRDLDRGADRESQLEYFVERNGNYEIVNSVKKIVEFRRVNLVKPLADTAIYELILCRNILIYFDEPTRSAVLKQLIDRLVPGGYLMLGAAESLPSTLSGMSQLQCGRTTVYRKG
jgi:chemotaxis protein methyltransferase CheR